MEKLIGSHMTHELNMYQNEEQEYLKKLRTITFKSILPSKGDEVKRREARRKSLANRRVSFAPEATLHTWDVIEYVRDATVSSTDSAQSPRKDDGNDETVPATPDNQSRAQQKKRRRSSVIPPLNFNDPDDLYSSSPANDSSPVADSGGGVVM